MNNEPRYTNRQIERMLDEQKTATERQLEKQSLDLKEHITGATAPILVQTLKTNGRVSELEKNQKKLVVAIIAIGGVLLGMAGANPSLLKVLFAFVV